MKTVSCQHIIPLYHCVSLSTYTSYTTVCRAGDLLEPAAAGVQGELRGAALLQGPGQVRAARLGQRGEGCQCIA